MWIESITPLTVRLRGKSIELTPGQPVNLEEPHALRLLAKVPGKVRLVPATEPVTGELFWENPGTGEIRGPATLLDRMTIQEGDHQEEWLLIEFEGAMFWIRDFTLRTRQQWRFQKPIRTATPGVTEPRGKGA